MRALLRTFPIAWQLLADRPATLVISSLGVAFSVLIMFMEFGFFNGSNDSSANLPPLFDCDLVVSHVGKTNLKTGEEFPALRLNQVRSVPGVRAVSALYTTSTYWWNPQTGARNRAHVLGFNLAEPMLRLPEIAAHRAELQLPGTVLFDRLSRPDLGVITTGTRTTLGRSAARVVGLFDLGANFTYEGHIATSADNFLLLTGENPDAIDLGLVRVEPGAEVDAVRRRLQAALPPDVLVLTPRELLDREVAYTTLRLPAGAIFGMGLVVGFIIGLIVCYQILFNQITDHLPQFATLKAMGHAPGFIAGIVSHSALVLAFLGYLPGLAAAVLLYRIIEELTQIRMILTGPRALVILALSAAMCLAASRLALKKVRSADPAELY